jgi:cytochrome P450
MEFAYGSKDILSKATRAMNGKPFQVYSTQGFMTVLPSKHIQETRNDDRFDFGAHAHRAFNGSTPGFEAFDQRNDMSWWLVQIAQKHLTAYLNQMSVPLSEECSKDLEQYLTNDPKWHTINPSEQIGRIVSKMSTRIFLGQEFCEDERWIEASSNYSTKVFMAQDRLSLWPPYLRSVVHWFLPYCQQLRKDVAVCREVIERKLKERENAKILREKQGEAPDEAQDTLEWMKKVAKGRTFDPTKVQLSLSMAAIHTTTDLITWLLLCLAQNPETIQPLRNEMISVLKADGWKKTSLYNLKLLDSAMKESQRLKPNVLGE